MAGKRGFGWHSGNLEARNLVAGTFTISGNATVRNYDAVSFPHSLKSAPDGVVVTQVADEASFSGMVSGNRFVVSGLTSSGFTLVSLDEGMGAYTYKYNYVAFDYV